ncbi:MAG: ATP synthase F1 subunit delta [Polyangiaceae bacterium]|nr:ATP synthase F1 subunit delta [Polyangiaceae bacterium]
MISSAIVDRYARAIFELGVETGQLSQLTEQVRSFAAVFASSKELRMVAENPLVPEDQRDGILKEIGSRLGLGEHAINSVRVLAARRRLAALPDVAKRLGSLADEKAGVVRAKVTSAAPLSEDFYVKLAQKLEAKTLKKVVIEREHDPSLISGVVTKLGDNTIDGSLKGRLQALERSLLQV